MIGPAAAGPGTAVTHVSSCGARPSSRRAGFDERTRLPPSQPQPTCWNLGRAAFAGHAAETQSTGLTKFGALTRLPSGDPDTSSEITLSTRGRGVRSQYSAHSSSDTRWEDDWERTSRTGTSDRGHVSRATSRGASSADGILRPSDALCGALTTSGWRTPFRKVASSTVSTSRPGDGAVACESSNSTNSLQSNTSLFSLLYAGFSSRFRSCGPPLRFVPMIDAGCFRCACASTGRRGARRTRRRARIVGIRGGCVSERSSG
mmetsp:Transcript_28540/g.88325  ORF Transcript_28540/g.88325 Transcript_28540/m.88325 type:complete len:261 (+) Transcript_28540:225-1007(+)